MYSPAGIEVVAEQRSPEWFAARCGLPTASMFSVLMAGPKYAGWKNYRAELVAQRLSGMVVEGYKSPAMKWGTDNEPLARLMYALETGNQVRECGFFKGIEIEAGASPDGEVDEDGSLEIKCPETATHIATLRTNTVPKVYYWQMQGQMWMAGKAWCDFTSFDPRLPKNAQLFIQRVPRDDDDIAKLEATLRVFLEEVDEEVEFIRNYGLMGAMELAA